MLLLIDKPKGITSHDVVHKVRKITGERKVGHAGTLDPNATGLLILGVGRESTKKLGEITKNTNKVYLAELFLGATSSTDDSEGTIEVLNDQIKPSESDIEDILMTFEGESEQIPPSYSAIKVGGRKAYEMARKGKPMKLEPRKINVYSIKLESYDYPTLKIYCDVSSGTYIRSLARDIGDKLKTGAYLKELRRIKIGEFDIKDAIELSNLTDQNWSKSTK